MNTNEKKKGNKERKKERLQHLPCEYCSYFVEHNLLPPNNDAP